MLITEDLFYILTAILITGLAGWIYWLSCGQAHILPAIASFSVMLKLVAGSNRV